MHRTDADGHVSNLFDDGDPGVPRLPTQIDKDWLNAVQEELANAITNAGVALVKGTNTQLRSILANLTTHQVFTGLKEFWAGLIVETQSSFTSTAPGEQAATFEADDAEAATFTSHSAGNDAAVKAIKTGGAGVAIEADVGNTLAPTIRPNGTIDFTTSGTPASTAGFTNQLTKKSVVKAWGLLFNTNGTVSVVDGFNVAGTSVSGTQYHRVTLADDMGSSDYVVLATMMQKATQNVSILAVNACNLAAGSFDLAFYDIAAHAQKSIDASIAYHVSFVVLGSQ